MCATEYNLGRHCGVTFAGIKPASLFTIKEEEKGTLKGFAKKFRIKGFVFVPMKALKEKRLFYVYHRKHLEKILCTACNRLFLEKYGYVYKTSTEAVSILKRRLQQDSFPHEIGIFLGYPLEDVQGFIAEPKATSKICGYWKVYHNVDEKQKLFERFKMCTDCICRRMHEGQSLTEIFQIKTI